MYVGFIYLPPMYLVVEIKGIERGAGGRPTNRHLLVRVDWKSCGGGWNGEVRKGCVERCAFRMVYVIEIFHKRSWILWRV